MAAGMLSSPGDALGPCTIPCKHLDCKETRDMAACVCEYCQGIIGYETRFYQLSKSGEPRRLVHAVCREDAIERVAKISKFEQDKFKTTWYVYYISGWKSSMEKESVKHQDYGEEYDYVFELAIKAIPCTCRECTMVVNHNKHHEQDDGISAAGHGYGE